MKMRKKLVIGCLLLVMVMVLSIQFTALAKDVLRVWTLTDIDTTPVKDEVIAEFERTHPEIEVEHNTFGWGDYRVKLVASIASGTGPDVFSLDTAWLPEYATEGYISTMPNERVAELKENLLQSGINHVSYEGMPWGYPFDVSTHAFFYNKEHFREAGLDPSHGPKDFDEVLDYAIKLTKKENGQIMQSGYWINKRLMYLADWLNNVGASVVNEKDNGSLRDEVKGTLDTPKAMKVWKLWDQLYNEHEVGNLEVPDRAESFPLGIVSMCQTGNFLISNVNNMAPDLDWAVDVFPTELETSIHMTGGWMMTVNENSNKKEAAWEFAKLMDSYQIDFAIASGHMVTRKSAIEDPRLRENVSEQYMSFVTAYKTALKTRPQTTQWREMTSKVEPIIEEFLLGKYSPEEAAKKANEEVNKILDAARKRGDKL